MSDTELTWLIPTVSLIFRTVLLKFSVHQIHQEAMSHATQNARLRSRILIQEIGDGA